MRGLALALVLLAALLPGAVLADWKVTELPKTEVPVGSFAEPGKAAPEGLPDGRMIMATSGDIEAAWYTRPTTRYGHGILGDAIEAGALALRLRDGSRLEHVLQETEVFEDRYPRLADLDGDGRLEVITIRSSVSHGGSVAVFAVKDSELREIAATGFIGLANRWLNIAGIADFRGSGRKQIAFVRTPHIGGILLFYELHGGRLEHVGDIHGFSNHAIGATEMRLSAVADINDDGRPDLILPSDARNTLRMIGFAGSEPVELDRVDLPAPVETAIIAEGEGASLSFTLGLRDGRVVTISR